MFLGCFASCHDIFEGLGFQLHRSFCGNTIRDEAFQRNFLPRKDLELRQVMRNMKIRGFVCKMIAIATKSMVMTPYSLV